MEDRREESMLSNRLSGLLEIFGREKVTSFLSEYETGRFCKRVDNVQLIWLIVGFGLFVHKSYRELFRLINFGSLKLPSRATLAAGRKRLRCEWLEELQSREVDPIIRTTGGPALDSGRRSFSTLWAIDFPRCLIT
jgi:hypothetical protein